MPERQNFDKQIFDKQIIDRQKIDLLIADGMYDQALECLDHNVIQQPDDAMWWFLRGRLYWRLDQRGRAISDYEEAVFLDPDSPAVQALQMAREVMDYRNTDLLNP